MFPTTQRLHPLIFLACAVVTGGCGQTPELPGGTKGILLVAGGPIADIQINLYRNGTDTPIAFGVSGIDGHFELRDPGTLEAVWLEPGQYRMTIESVGAHYLAWPPPYNDPVKTPLQQDWSAEANEFRVEVPVGPKAGK